MKELIITADDFGMAPSVNEAVIEAHSHGVLTSASLMVNGAAFEDAVLRARQTPSLAVGLHLALVRGKATLPPRQIPHLVDEQGRFGNHPVGAGCRYYFTSRLHAEIESEVRAQIERFLATGLVLDHLDGHLNIHLHPTVFDIVVRLSDEYPIPALRVPRQPWWSTLRAHRRAPLGKTLHALIFQLLGARARAALRQRGPRCADHVYGLLESGDMNEPYLLDLLRRLPDGLSEIYCHPARSPDDEFRRRNPTCRAEAEYRALTSRRVRDLLGQLGIRLVTWARSCESAGG